MQVESRDFNAHQPAVKVAGFQSTLMDRILKVLADSVNPMDSHAVEAAVRRMFPGVTIGQGSVQAVLSSMYRNGLLTGDRRAGDMRTRYTVSPLVEQLEAPKKTVPKIHTGSDSQSSTIPLKTRVLKILNDSDVSMTSQEVDAEVRRRFPDLHVAGTSVGSMLSVMLHRNHTVMVDRDVVGTITHYTTVRPTTSVSRPEPSASGVAGVLRFSPECSPLLYTALTALADHRGWTADRDGVDIIARQAMREFFNIEPYKDSEFCWVKYRPMNGPTFKVGVTLSGESSTRMMKLIETAQVENRVAVNGVQQSGSKQINKTMMGYTALVWYLAVCTKEEERMQPAVKDFMDYAVREFLVGGRSAVVAYQRLRQNDVSASAEKSADIPPVAAESGPEVLDGGPGLSMGRDESGGLHISIRFSPEIMERLVLLVMGVVNHSP